MVQFQNDKNNVHIIPRLTTVNALWQSLDYKDKKKPYAHHLLILGLRRILLNKNFLLLFSRFLSAIIDVKYSINQRKKNPDLIPWSQHLKGMKESAIPSLSLLPPLLHSFDERPNELLRDGSIIRLFCKKLLSSLVTFLFFFIEILRTSVLWISFERFVASGVIKVGNRRVRSLARVS